MDDTWNNWRDISDPTNEALAELIREVNVVPTDAEFLVSDYHSPEISVRSNYMLMLVYVPVFDKKTRVTTGVPLYIIITSNKIYTLHYQPIVALEKIHKDLTEHPEKASDHMQGSMLELALYVVYQLNIASAKKLARLSKHIEIAEDAVSHGNERKMVEEIAILTRDVLDFRKAILPQRDLFTSFPEIEQSSFFTNTLLTPSSAMQWHRINNQLQQLWELLQGLMESVKELRNTNDSLLQYKENELLRMISIYSALAIPLLIVTSVYNPKGTGNIVSDYVVFWGILGLLITVILYIFLRAKRRKVL